MKVSEIMKTDLITADPEASATLLSRMMANNQLGSVIIKDLEKDEPMGIVTWSSIITLVGKGGNTNQTKAKNMISRKLITVDEESDILEASKTMAKHGIDRLPIVDSKGKLKGILSYKDILAAAPGMISVMSEKLKATRMRPPSFSDTIAGMCEDCGNFSNKLENIASRWTCGECFDG